MTKGLTPPHDLDAEAVALSTVLYGDVDADYVLEALEPETFYSDANGRIFEAARAVRDAGARPNAPTIVGWLRARGKLETVGGAAYVKELELNIPYSATVQLHCATLRNLASMRRLIATCQTIAAEGYGDVGDVRAWLDDAETRVRAIAAGGAEDNSAESAFETMHRVFTAIQAGEVPGIETGLADLDGILCGMRGGQMITVGAHSGIGKSALVACIVSHVAQRCTDRSVLMFSLEMTKDEVVQRLLFAEARVNSSKIGKAKWMTEEDWRALSAAAKNVGVHNLITDDKPGLSVAQIRARARRKAVEFERAGRPLALVAVDYAQLVSGGPANKNRNREQEVAEVSRALKQLAKELNVPVIVLAQLNEDSRKDKRRPSGRDLRESRALHHDSDKVILIYNPHADDRAAARRAGIGPDRRYDPSAESGEAVELIVDKNRGGTTGTADVMFFPTFTSFTNNAEGA